MKELHEFLNEREIFVLENHPAMTYKAIGEKFGVTHERVRQIKVKAERKVRSEEKREKLEAIGRQTVLLELERREVWLLLNSLQTYFPILRIKQKRKENAPGIDTQMAEELEARLRMI